MMDAADYLFPRELRVSDVKISKVMFVGSCMASDYLRFYRKKYKGVKFEYIEFNNLAQLPDLPAEEVRACDVQIVQLPIRFILSDRIVQFNNFQDPVINAEILANARNALRISLDNAMKYYRETKVMTLVTNFIVPTVVSFAGLGAQSTDFDLGLLIRELNRELAQMIAQLDGVNLLDVENIASTIGKRYFFDDAIVFFGHGGFWFPDWNGNEVGRMEAAPPIEGITPSHLDQFMVSVWEQMLYFVRVHRQLDMVKLVIFDLDDTLWRGQIAEHYNEDGNRPMYFGWPLGLSEAIHHLRARGILVAVCSKNNEDTVLRLWDKAAPAGWVKPHHFVTTEINWNPKAENVARIMDRVNLTAKSVVFVDDNPVERQSVKAAFPEIRLLGWDPFSTRRILLCAPETQLATITSESRNRETMLKQQQERDASRTDTMSRDEFLMSLDCRVRVAALSGPADENFARCFELLNKTNQFNTTGRRWSRNELEDYLAAGGRGIYFDVIDKFTEYGIVGLILLDAKEFTQYVMSCRVIGLDVELAVLHYVMNEARTGSDRQFTALTVETELNKVSRNIYQKSGFVPVQDTGLLRREHDRDLEIPRHINISVKGAGIAAMPADAVAS